eukprot:m.273283 g.273283  ORF g.273283 m.273283 type:complete len:340 (-) comp54814_c0_seq49:276-1295(-)
MLRRGRAEAHESAQTLLNEETREDHSSPVEGQDDEHDAGAVGLKGKRRTIGRNRTLRGRTYQEAAATRARQEQDEEVRERSQQPPSEPSGPIAPLAPAIEPAKSAPDVEPAKSAPTVEPAKSAPTVEPAKSAPAFEPPKKVAPVDLPLLSQLEAVTATEHSQQETKATLPEPVTVEMELSHNTNDHSDSETSRPHTRSIGRDRTLRGKTYAAAKVVRTRQEEAEHKQEAESKLLHDHDSASAEPSEPSPTPHRAIARDRSLHGRTYEEAKVIRDRQAEEAAAASEVRIHVQVHLIGSNTQFLIGARSAPPSDQARSHAAWTDVRGSGGNQGGAKAGSRS